MRRGLRATLDLGLQERYITPMKTYSAYDAKGNIVKFSVLTKGNCIFSLRAAAMAECDKLGWVLRRAEIL